MKKKLIAILIILAVYIGAVCASFLLLSGAKTTFPGTDVEYLSLRYTGGYTGRIDDYLRVYREGGKYYLESSGDDGVRYELTRTEYLLCTDIDYDMLRDADGVNGSDLIYTDVEYGLKHGETVTLPRKCYWEFPGMITFFARTKTIPEDELTKADKLASELGEYFYQHNSPNARFVSCRFDFNGQSRNYVDIFYGKGSQEERYEFHLDCQDGIENKAGGLAGYGVDKEVSDEDLNEIFKDYKKITSGSQTLYYQVQSNDKVTLVTLIDYENHTYYCTYFDKNSASESEIRAIMEGKSVIPAGLYIALAVETVVMAAAVILVVRTKKKTAKGSAQNNPAAGEVAHE